MLCPQGHIGTQAQLYNYMLAAGVHQHSKHAVDSNVRQQQQDNSMSHYNSNIQQQQQDRTNRKV